MLHIGCHESSSGGFIAMGNEALELKADTFAFFTRNPRGGQAKPVDKADTEAFCKFTAEHNFAQLVAHAPYTMNPCSANPHLREFALEMMIDDLKKMEYTPGNLYNFHPGSHVQQGADVGIDLTSTLIAEAIKATPDCTTTLLIETMAGKGSEIGKTFEEVKQILDSAEEKAGTPLPTRLGVCLDTCHIWDGGYDIVSDLDGVITNFDKIIGLKRLHAVHLNDSLNIRGAHKDRHAKIGEGEIGKEALFRVINHAALRNLPFILETPNEHDGYKAEIAMLREAYK
ncbi:MAG: deoxyribonuclease IV [Spirochaetaceae bacterium]|nr:deoxyribonuclease IV [Spirochaetaceae bacterium]